MPESADPTEVLKMVIVFRADLAEMTRAKSEIQAAHAAVALACNVAKHRPELLRRYLESGQPKTNVEVDSLEELRAVAAKAAKRGVPFEIIEDAGKTIFEVPTITCVMMGPMSKTDSNSITRGLRMRDPVSIEGRLGADPA